MLKTGKKRRHAEYSACTCELHQPCFKYTTVRLWSSEKEAVAFVALWANEPRVRPLSWSRAEHRSFVPSTEAVKATAALVKAETN